MKPNKIRDVLLLICIVGQAVCVGFAVHGWARSEPLYGWLVVSTSLYGIALNAHAMLES